MIWAGIIIVAALALAPLGWTLRSAAVARGRREAALALHRAQLEELSRDRAEGRIGPAEHEAAVLEVQRRLLAAAGAPDEDSRTQEMRGPVLVALCAVPIAGFLLYLTGGSPNLPAEPLQARIAQAEQQMHEEAALVAKLQSVLTKLDPHSERAREGYVLLGGAEARLGNLGAAAAAWRTALATRFDPTLAAEAAEATTEANGAVTEQAAALFRQALAAAPPDAPWRPMAERRLAEHPQLPAPPATPKTSP